MTNQNPYRFSSMNTNIQPIGIKKPMSLLGDYSTQTAYDPSSSVVQKEAVQPTYATQATQAHQALPELNTNNTQPGLWDRIYNSFTPNEKGTSTGGQIMGAIGTGVGAITSIASPILAYREAQMNQKIADRNFAEQQKQNEYLKSRDAMADAKVAQAQKNYDQTVTRML